MVKIKQSSTHIECCSIYLFKNYLLGEMNHCLANIGLSTKSLNIIPEQIKQGERMTKGKHRLPHHLPDCNVECYCRKARVKLVIVLSKEGPTTQYLIRI